MTGRKTAPVAPPAPHPVLSAGSSPSPTGSAGSQRRTTAAPSPGAERISTPTPASAPRRSIESVIPRRSERADAAKPTPSSSTRMLSAPSRQSRAMLRRTPRPVGSACRTELATACLAARSSARATAGGRSASPSIRVRTSMRTGNEAAIRSRAADISRAVAGGAVHAAAPASDRAAIASTAARAARSPSTRPVAAGMRADRMSSWTKAFALRRARTTARRAASASSCRDPAASASSRASTLPRVHPKMPTTLNARQV